MGCISSGVVEFVYIIGEDVRMKGYFEYETTKDGYTAILFYTVQYKCTITVSRMTLDE